MSTGRDSYHKMRATSDKNAAIRKKRKNELGNWPPTSRLAPAVSTVCETEVKI
ncbi:ribosomal protein S8 [Culex quinquefasciatus]|uniref:Ribosomal protein S8 n=1 Tax=Culex quinquefasciatus TaxID=7176 RepID=B0XC90_CULQU|nr:ribosomal protein S8 [Culex quinquefasciatus]|eukprot:XP_001867262.1 ribosomal protein S8 [Culex quinquefasciatus]